MEVKIQKLRPGAVTPRRGSADAAGYDLYACPADGQCVTIAPHATAMIGTGLALAIPAGYFGGVFARSGLASKQGLRPANCVGVIDADYRGECTVALHNDTDEVRTVAPGDRIAQLVILPFLAAEFSEADALDATVVLVVGAVREVKTGDVHARLDHLADGLVAIAGGTHGAYNLGALVHSDLHLTSSCADR